MEKKTVVLGVTGGIAAYKSAEIASRLRKAGVEVYVIMTEHATEFIAPLTFETLTGHAVAVDMFAEKVRFEVEHISLAKRADVFLIAPATAKGKTGPFPLPFAERAQNQQIGTSACQKTQPRQAPPRPVPPSGAA